MTEKAPIISARVTRTNRKTIGEHLSDAEARTLRTCIEENGLRWGAYGPLANVGRRDVVIKLQRSEMIERLPSTFSDMQAWKITEKGLEALARYDARKTRSRKKKVAP